MPAKGTRTGAAIFEGVAEAVSRASDAHAPKAAAVRDKALTAFMERGERELAGPLRGIMDELLASEALPDHYRAIFERVSSPERQFDFLYDVAAVLSFVLSAAFAVGQPLVQGVLNEIWARHPSMPLRPQDAAEGWLRGAMDSGEAEAEALASGTDLRRFRILQELAGNPPGPQELLEMWRRDIIGDSKLERGIRQSRLRNEWTEELKALATRLLDVQAVLEGVRRGLVTRGEAERELRGHGFSAQGVEVLLAPESGSSVGGLVNVTPSLSDFIRFAGREVFEPDQRAALGIDDEFPAQMATFATQLGISERFARDYWAAHWDIPSVQQGIEMLHRRVISRADLE
ncbi:MAG: hypothetical protein ACREKK_08880, partial [Candidatus Methylomirabilales bacterium]